MIDALKLGAVKLLPQNTVSRAFGAISEVAFPSPLQGAINVSFATLAGIDVQESERPPTAYRTLNAFFTRKLRAGARSPQGEGPAVMNAPVDGRLTHFGALERGTMIQAKGKRYTVADLLDSGAEAQAFHEGHYATFYLSPRDYHRIHTPAMGRLVKAGYIPGRLLPVAPFSVDRVDQLYAVNERLIVYVESEALGRVAVVMVGATCVGRIGLSFSDFETNGPFRRRQDMRLGEPIALEHGDEVGVFNLGSTVVVLVAEPDFAFDPGLRLEQVIRMGQYIGEAP